MTRNDHLVFYLNICFLYVQDNKVEPQRYYELFEKDTIKFGNSRYDIYGRLNHPFSKDGYFQLIHVFKLNSLYIYLQFNAHNPRILPNSLD